MCLLWKMTAAANFDVEREYWASGKLVMGMDETGYGSAVASLCVAGVIFPIGMSERDLPPGLKDSKKLSPGRRDLLYDAILSKALAVEVVYGTAEEIDSTDVLATNMRCMAAVIEGIAPSPEFVLIDGIHRPKTCTPENSKTIVGGDNLSASIAAASIVAKVTRDRYVKALVRDNPELEKYGIGSNMGYLSRQHREALDIYGRTGFHRQSYRYRWQQQRQQT